MSFEQLAELKKQLTKEVRQQAGAGQRRSKDANRAGAIQKTVDPVVHAIGRLQATDLPKVQQAIKNLDPNVTPATEIEGAKAQLQGYVRGARKPEEIDKVKAAFTSAGVTVD